MVRTFEEFMVRTFEEELKMIQKVCTILMAITFACGLVIGIIIGVNK